jgi:hypothetical protein
MDAAKALPPTTWWMCGEGVTPGLTRLDGCSKLILILLKVTYGSSLSTVICEQPNRSTAVQSMPFAKSSNEGIVKKYIVQVDHLQVMSGTQV